MRSVKAVFIELRAFLSNDPKNIVLGLSEMKGKKQSWFLKLNKIWEID